MRWTFAKRTRLQNARHERPVAIDEAQMTDDERSKGIGGDLVPQANRSELVVRSPVPAKLPYDQYRQFLRRDFFYSCAYCTICEAEATTIRFTIDHYEPKSSHPSLANDYSNLMYCCDTCNLYKGDLVPPPNARAEGVRYFRPDSDVRSDHFELSGVRLEAKSRVGQFSIDTIELNRAALRRLRNIRQRLHDCDQLVSEGVRALRQFRLDELPSTLKGSASATIANAANVAERMANEIDQLLSGYARSPLADIDPDAEARATDRARKINAWQALHPGAWRKRKVPAASPRRGGRRMKAKR